MEIAKFIPTLKNNSKLTSLLKDHNLTFEDVSVIEFTGKSWIIHQQGKSEEMVIMLIDGKIQVAINL